MVRDGTSRNKATASGVYERVAGASHDPASSAKQAVPTKVDNAKLPVITTRYYIQEKVAKKHNGLGSSDSLNAREHERHGTAMQTHLTVDAPLQKSFSPCRR